MAAARGALVRLCPKAAAGLACSTARVGGTLDGHGPNAVGIKPEQMTDAVWDYILGGAALPDDQLPAGVSRASLDKMKREFDYWCASQRDCGP